MSVYKELKQQKLLLDAQIRRERVRRIRAAAALHGKNLSKVQKRALESMEQSLHDVVLDYIEFDDYLECVEDLFDL